MYKYDIIFDTHTVPWTISEVLLRKGKEPMRASRSFYSEKLYDKLFVCYYTHDFGEEVDNVFETEENAKSFCGLFKNTIYLMQYKQMEVKK